MAESGPSFSWISGYLNVRFREKQTFSLGRLKTSSLMSAFHSKPDIKLELVKRSANDPMVGPGMGYDKMITGEHIKSRDKPTDDRPGPSEMF